jgi:cadmium resistance protein CadD (predicted permease)
MVVLETPWPWICWMFFALSVATTYILTNIDGLFAFLALAATGRKPAAIVGFLLAQVVVIGGAVLVGGGAALLAPADLGLLGIVPVALGFREVLKNRRKAAVTEKNPPAPGSIIGVVVLFLALSTDTFVLMATFFADTRPELDRFVLSGALIAVATLLALGTFLSRLIKPTPATEKFFERLAPLVMIVAGLYILMDTQTDVF